MADIWFNAMPGNGPWCRRDCSSPKGITMPQICFTIAGVRHCIDIPLLVDFKHVKPPPRTTSQNWILRSPF